MSDHYFIQAFVFLSLPSQKKLCLFKTFLHFSHSRLNILHVLIKMNQRLIHVINCRLFRQAHFLERSGGKMSYFLMVCMPENNTVNKTYPSYFMSYRF